MKTVNKGILRISRKFFSMNLLDFSNLIFLGQTASNIIIDWFLLLVKWVKFLCSILTTTGECYQYGHVFNGVLNLNRGLTGKCETNPPARKWFDLKVVVSKTESQVEVLLQDATIAKIKPTLPYLTKGGVLVPNGFRNLVMFRNFVIKKGVTNWLKPLAL